MPDIQLNRLSREKAELRKCKNLGLKGKPFSQEQLSQIIAEGEGVIRHYIELYREEFEKFFKKRAFSLVGFDIEEMNQFSICLMGLKINPDLTITVKPITLKGAPSIQQNNQFENVILQWIQQQGEKCEVCIHGFNKTEKKLFGQITVPRVNTQNMLNYAIANKIQPIPQSSGLHSFEKAIGFQRHYCGFIKDYHLASENIQRKHLAMMFPSQAMSSLIFRQHNRKIRICQICEKPQDVLMYCMEDVFVTLLINIYYSNRGIKIEDLDPKKNN